MSKSFRLPPMFSRLLSLKLMQRTSSVLLGVMLATVLLPTVMAGLRTGDVVGRNLIAVCSSSGVKWVALDLAGTDNLSVLDNKVSVKPNTGKAYGMGDMPSGGGNGGHMLDCPLCVSSCCSVYSAAFPAVNLTYTAQDITPTGKSFAQPPRPSTLRPDWFIPKTLAPPHSLLLS